MGLFGKKKQSEPRLAMVEGDGTYSFKDVVGESNYRQALKALISEGTEVERDNGEVYRHAYLVPEPTNAFDKNAIQVRMGEYVVGYIAKGRTAEFHPVIKQAKNQGCDYLVVPAVIGWNPNSADPLVGVRLDWTDD